MFFYTFGLILVLYLILYLVTGPEILSTLLENHTTDKQK